MGELFLNDVTKQGFCFRAQKKKKKKKKTQIK